MKKCQFYGHTDSGMCTRCDNASRHDGKDVGWWCRLCPRAAHPECNGFCSEHKDYDEDSKNDLKHGSIFFDEDGINEWLATGCHVSKAGKRCSVCLGDNVPVHSKWNCMCPPTTCKGCMDKVHKCPICRVAVPYKRLSPDQLDTLIVGRFSTESLRRVGMQLYSASGETRFNPSALITTCDDAISALARNKMLGNDGYVFKTPPMPNGSKDALHMHIGSIVLDGWNLSLEHTWAPAKWKLGSTFGFDFSHTKARNYPCYHTYERIWKCRRLYDEEWMDQTIDI
jgi:hypothetical protein